MKNIERVLVIEDNPEDSEMITDTLKEVEGLTWKVAVSLESGLYLAKQFKPDATLLDLSLPGYKNLESLKFYLEQNRHIPVVVLTGMSPEMGNEAIKAGAQDFIHKSDGFQARLKQMMNFAVLRSERIEDMEKFCRSVTHDLRGPIANAISYLELMEMDPNSAQKLIPLVKRNLTRVLDYSDNLLDYFVAHSKDLVLTSGSMKTLALEIIDDLIQQNDSSVIINLHGHTEGKYFYDGMRMVLLNLIQNAIKYRRESMPLEINIFFSTGPDGHMVILKDNGLGMNKETLTKVTHLFERDTHRGHGHGIGLAAVNDILKRMKGGIIVESQLHVGTTIIIRLPNA